MALFLRFRAIPAQVGPGVRIRLAPAESLQRTEERSPSGVRPRRLAPSPSTAWRRASRRASNSGGCGSSVARIARDATAVLLARAWWHCHGADPRLAALPGHQRAQQYLAVDRIRLGALVASRHGIDAGSTTWLSTPLASSKR